VWLRHDLRLADNPALQAAAATGAPVVPVYIWAPEEEGAWSPGGASKWWLGGSLASLDRALRERGSRLTVARGACLPTLMDLAGKTGARAVFWNRRYEPVVRERDGRIKEALRQEGLRVESFNAGLLHEPWTVENKAKRPFQVFTPFWRCCLAKEEPPVPTPAPDTLTAPKRWPGSLALSDLGLGPKPDWASGLRATWRPGEAGARERLERFVAKALAQYAEHRNRPDLEGTSSLSPHLHFGEISPRQIWHAIRHAGERARDPRWRESQFLAEIGWREFSHHLIYHFPHTDTRPLRAEFEGFPWKTDPAGLAAWQKGLTGYPLVDAGMRQLWTTGWMHNRVRMVVASFLVKDLLVSWQEGARWFWDTLVDADLAQNSLGWQWTSGCGADAAPYFRVFNPISQGAKFDPTGAYVRRWVPELAAMPDEWIHQPHLAPPEVLHRSGVELDADYPRPIISHTSARERALAAYSRLK
jgi:deoxyribodipyrimidine photo-lyase